MSFQRFVKVIVYLTVVIWGLALLVSGVAFSASWLKALSISVTIVSVIAMVFDLWLWKLPVFQPLVRRPFLGGTWKVAIQSDWKDPTTGQIAAPTHGYMVVRQTLSTLSMRFFTAESHSELVGTEMVCAADGVHCVSGVYRNEPRLAVRKRSPIHFGAVWLRISTDPTLEMEGHYWTDRDTKGEMRLYRRENRLFQSFNLAEGFFEAHSATQMSNREGEVQQ